MSDNFGSTIDESGTGKKTFKKTPYLALKSGEYTIRILDPMETRKDGHYFVGRGWIECLGDECPVCLNNKKILYEHPEDFREVDGWCPKRPRFYLNVLDRADGQVKVLNCGPRLIEDLKTMSRAIRNEQDERIDIRHYDWILTVRGEGREKDITPAHKFYGKETEPQVGEQTLYDFEKIMIRLTPEEMLDVFNGASLKDVFAVRRANKESKSSDNFMSEDIRSEIEDSVDSLFQG